jgi:hypothetical protein
MKPTPIHTLAGPCPECDEDHLDLEELLVVDWGRDRSGEVIALDDLTREDHEYLPDSHAIVVPGYRAPCGFVWRDDADDAPDLDEQWACAVCDTRFAAYDAAEACCSTP